MADDTANTIVSHEQDGKILTGVGASAEELSSVMDRHSPEPPPEPAPASGEPPAEPLPKRTKGQARFVELDARAKAAEEKASAAERRAAELEARLAHPPAAPAQAAPAAESVPRSPVGPERGDSGHSRPEPSEDDIGTKYATYAAFTKDQALWVWEQQQQQLDQRIRYTIEGDRAARTAQEQIAKTHAAGRAAYADFDQVLQSGPGGQVQIGPDRCQAIYQLPNSEHVQYAIMKDAALAQKLATVDPITFGMELAKLTNGHQPAATTPAISAAPAPFQPVGTGSKSTAPPSAELADKGFDFDASGYRQKRAAERGVKPRRFGR